MPNTQQAGERLYTEEELLPGVRVPVTTLRGAKEGSTVLITAGIHCREFVGIEATIRLARELSPETLVGTVILVHACNITGLFAASEDIVPEDGKNLNRVFPGNPEGSMTDRLAAALEERFLTRADYHIDLHGGGAFETLFPHVYRQGKAAPEVLAKSREMCRRVHVRYMGSATLDTGGIYNRAGAMGVPGVLIERGGRSLWTEEEVAGDLEDLRNLLRYLEVLQDGTPAVEYPVEEIPSLHFTAAARNGLWHPTRTPGDPVRKGDLLGTVDGFDGRVLQEIRAEEDGVLLYIRCLLGAREGDFLTAIGAVERA